MPKFRGDQVLVYVTLVNNYKYGWKQNEQKFNALKTSHGIKSAVGVKGVFFGANSPKPGIARKKQATGIVSSFYDPAKATSLKKAGWQVNNGDASQGIRVNGLSVTVAVETPFGYEYAWNVAKTDLKKVKALGAKQPTDPTKLVWGSYPKPPRAVIKEASGSFSTFIPPNQTKIDDALKKGYSVEALDDDWKP